MVVLAPRINFTSQLAPLVIRSLPVRLPPSLAPTHHIMVIELVAPDSHRFATPPPDADHDGGKFGKAALSYKLSGTKRKLTIKRHVAFHAAHIAVADYPAWRHWLRGIDRIMHRSVRLTKK